MDVSVMAEMLRTPMKEYVASSEIVQVTIHTRNSEGDLESHELETYEAIANFIIDAFIKMTNGSTNS